MEKKFFDYLNKHNIEYAVTRGYDKKSEEQKKDIDILISKKDYEQLQQKKLPTTKREIDFYINKETHVGITFIPQKALKRRIYNKEKGIYELGTKDKKRMKKLRTLLHVGRKIKRKLGLYK